MSELLEIVANRLKQCRQNSGWTLTETANRLQALSGEAMNSSRYSNWELGLRMPPPEQIIKLAKLFGKPAAWLQGYTDNDSLSAVSSNYVTANSPTLQTRSGLIQVAQATDCTAYSLTYLSGRGLNKNKLISIVQLDSSMGALIPEGSEVLLDCDQTEVRGADLFGIVVSGNIWVRWICGELDGSYTLRAEDNKQYPDKTLTKEQLEALDIVGRVARISYER